MSDLVDDFLLDGLRMWKDEGLEAPLNELQSISAWLDTLGEHGAEETMDRMRMRMILLMDAAATLHAQGSEAVKAAGIYVNRPDLDPEVADEAARH